MSCFLTFLIFCYLEFVLGLIYFCVCENETYCVRMPPASCKMTRSCFISIQQIYIYTLLLKMNIVIYINSYEDYVTTCFICLCLYGGRIRSGLKNILGNQIRWMTLHHQEVGGLTSFKCEIGVLSKWNNIKHQVIVFSQFKRLLSIIYRLA